MIKLTRRETLIGAVAVGATALPIANATANTPVELEQAYPPTTPSPMELGYTQVQQETKSPLRPDYISEIMEKFRRNYQNYWIAESNLSSFIPFDQSESHWVLDIVKNLADQGHFKLSNIMTSPIGTMTRSFKTSYTMELAQDLKHTHGGLEAEKELIRLLTNELSAEMNKDIHSLKQDYYPYLPLIAVRFVDTHTFQPAIGFKSQYALAEPGWKIENSTPIG